MHQDLTGLGALLEAARVSRATPLDSVTREGNMPKTAKPKKTWIYAPKKPTPPKAPEALKREVETKADSRSNPC